MFTINNIAIDLSGNEFLEPYVRRQIPAVTPSPDVDCTVKVVTADSPDWDKPACAPLASDAPMPVAVIRCPYIVGTGMTGLMQRIAAGIYKGTYVHIHDCQARLSVVHAVDVARAVSTAAGTQGSYTLTDGTDPTIHDLAEALAYRIGDKRIITIKPRWARLWYGSTYFKTLTTDHICKSTFTEIFPDFKPVEVTNYLHTHVYDEASL